MIRKMRIGQLQAAAMTAGGIGRIHLPALSVGFPLLVRTDEEIDRLLERVSPDLESGIEKSGYKLIAWSTSGWIYFFSRKPVTRPDDLRAQKLWMWEGDPDELATWTALGFQVVPLKATDVMIALQSGMIDACSVSPIAAAVYQWFALAPNMLDLKWAPLYGGLVVTRGAWEQIPADLRPRLLESARTIAREMNSANRDGERQALEAMTSRGLRITRPTQQDFGQWERLTGEAAGRLVGRMFDRDSYEKAARELQTIRR
jgi:TRAP-type C4-dicarboxylate transport system substrate-binding protein